VKNHFLPQVILPSDEPQRILEPRDRLEIDGSFIPNPQQTIGGLTILQLTKFLLLFFTKILIFKIKLIINIDFKIKLIIHVLIFKTIIL
jgi:hypothetical protein